METAACLCGEVSIKVKGAPLNSRCCHCQQCQKATSSAFFTRVLFNQSDVEIVGEIESYSSSIEIDRLSCKKCGTPIAACRKDGSVVGIALNLFESSHLFPPTEHIWVSESVVLDFLNDELPRYLKGKAN